MSMQNEFSLKGKTILVTGGAGFLGKYFSKALAEAGGRVVVTDKNEEAALAGAAELGEGHLGLSLDVTNQASVEAAFEKAGQVEVVVNNAAIDPKFDPSADNNSQLFENYPEELLNASVNVNLLGYVRVAQAAVKRMLVNGSGNIINISSIYGMSGPDQTIYPAGTQKPVDYAITKGGVVMLTKWLATTYGQNGVRANTLSLGGVFKGHDQEFVRKYGQHNAFRRMTEPAEVGAPLVFLAANSSRGMTGQMICVDGGWKI